MTYPVFQLFPRGPGIAEVLLYKVPDWEERVGHLRSKFPCLRNGPKWRDGIDTIAILSEPDPPYDGVSVTNGFECAATQVIKNYNIVLERTIWFEHYPFVAGEHEIVPGERPSFCYVALTWQARPLRPGSEAVFYTACHPQWHPIPRALMGIMLAPNSMLSWEGDSDV